MVNDKHFNNLENEKLSLLFIEGMEIEDEEYQKHITHSFNNTVARHW